MPRGCSIALEALGAFYGHETARFAYSIVPYSNESRRTGWERRHVRSAPST